jgi:glycosyltransferase involved in cell wall biosynthesis
VSQSPYEAFCVICIKKIAYLVGCKIVLIIESHGDFEKSLFLQRKLLFPKVYDFLMRYCASVALENADLLRSVSHSTKCQLERRISGKQILQFPAWTDIEVFLEAKQKDEECLGQDILYAGVLIPGKGVHHLIRAFAHISEEFPGARLCLVGRPENKTYAQDLKTQVRALGLVEYVQFIDEVSQPDLARWMHAASVFVLPSVSEGLGRVLVEAMASSTPVIASNVGGIAELVENGTTGFLVPPADESALAERIRWILTHPDCAHAMGIRAHLFAKGFFSTQAYIQGYKQMFQIADAFLAS